MQYLPDMTFTDYMGKEHPQENTSLSCHIIRLRGKAISYKDIRKIALE